MADPTKYNDIDEFLDAFYDHYFGADYEPTDEEHEHFTDKVEGFIRSLTGERAPGRRRSRGQGRTPSAPRRRSGRTSSRETSGGYGLSALFGREEAS